MNTFPAHALTFLLTVGLIAGCSKSSSVPETVDQPAEEQVLSNSQNLSGTVTETMNSGGYTYVLVDDGNAEFWAAAPEFVVSVGEDVHVSGGMPMRNYHSSSLDRDFDVVYFEESIQVGDADNPTDAADVLPPGHPAPPTAQREAVNFEDIPVADDGITIAELFARRDELAGQTVVVTGKVVKFNPAVMGTNWLHLQDGTGEAGTNDLTVTTDTTVNVDDRVVIEGVVQVDKDLGSGYFYPVIIENATVTIE